MKGIAVNQVVLLVLATIVIALIGYFLYSTYISSNGTANSSQCSSAIFTTCGNCKACAQANGILWSALTSTSSVPSGCKGACTWPSSNLGLNCTDMSGKINAGNNLVDSPICTANGAIV